jgi:hypothetical protein
MIHAATGATNVERLAIRSEERAVEVLDNVPQPLLVYGSILYAVAF